ncbi:glycoside hydrolase family 6 protein [Streptomyces sp. gb14]|uniref:glycoside hydrolase family 6 protein n=1 Tax=Streptomyces sp. gb14 TaxID=1827753 RepID=UPI0015CF673D|nr:glycoside hydrolase family 6 protein [Streptomyces sp. gb14]
MGAHRRRLNKRVVVGLSAFSLLGGLGFILQTSVFATASPDASGGTSFYTNPKQQAARWVAQNSNDPKAGLIKSEIAEAPAATWFATYSTDSTTVTSAVREVTGGAAAKGQTAVLVPYMIPNRDCGSHSGGGAPDFAAYAKWIQAFAEGLGDREVYVLLEPDSIAQAASCNSSDKEKRLSALSDAGAKIKNANPKARVYYDAGHSQWKVKASDLKGAGVLRSGSGLVSNVSNYRTTADEVAYGEGLLEELGNPQGLGLVVDTSRNGNGPTADSQWCDPAGRALGTAPTTDTGNSNVDAFLWVKLPGEADGCISGAGQFVPDRAFELAKNAEGKADGPRGGNQPPAPGTSKPPTPPTSKPPTPPTSKPSTPPTGGAPTQSCTAKVAVTDRWNSGYRADVTLRNGSTALASWKVEWTFTSGERLVNAWNTVATQNGPLVKGTNAPYNGAVKAGDTLTLGFVAEGKPGTAPSFALNGKTCTSQR